MTRNLKNISGINGKKSVSSVFYEGGEWMKLTRNTKLLLLVINIILNIILRFQVVPNEIFPDSVSMHIMVNSINEFGYARWWLHPLSIFGLFPASYTSTMQFFLSGVSQCTGIEVRWTIFLYCEFIGLLSMFTAYLLAGKIINDDVFKILVAFIFSTSPAVLGYTTWTIPTRGLLVILAPLLIYILLKCRTSIKYVPLFFLLAFFLFATHHLFYFLLPAFFAFLLLSICFKLRHYINIKISEKINPIMSISGFVSMFSIPVLTGHFIGYSRYDPLWTFYVRYMGILLIFSFGGIVYLIFKKDKDFKEWFILLTLIMLTTFIYNQTYMKWFLPVFAAPLAGMGLRNIIRISEKRKYMLITIILLSALSFSAYYQFIHFLPSTKESPIHPRYTEESTYKIGRWMKEYIVNGSAISNDGLFGGRVFAASETTHFLIGSTVNDYIYGFINVDLSKFKRYPLTEEAFWFEGYKGPDPGEAAWSSVNKLHRSPSEYNIAYVVENKKANGYIIWHHKNIPSKLLQFAHKKDCIYDLSLIHI